MATFDTVTRLISRKGKPADILGYHSCYPNVYFSFLAKLVIASDADDALSSMDEESFVLDRSSDELDEPLITAVVDYCKRKVSIRGILVLMDKEEYEDAYVPIREVNGELLAVYDEDECDPILSADPQISPLLCKEELTFEEVQVLYEYINQLSEEGVYDLLVGGRFLHFDFI